MGCGLDSSPAGLRPFARVAKPHFKIKKAATRFPSSPLAPAVWRGRATRQAGGRPGFGRDGALRRPSARAFLSPAGRRFKIPPAKSGKAPAGTSPRNVPTKTSFVHSKLPLAGAGARPPIGTLLGSAPVPVAVFGVAPKSAIPTGLNHSAQGCAGALPWVIVPQILLPGTGCIIPRQHG